MSIKLAHFCTKTGKAIEFDGEPLVEEIEGSVAEYLYRSEVNWYVGAAYPGLTTAEDLSKHEGKHLQFGKKDRLYFSDRENLWQEIYDEPSAAVGGYGSLLIKESEGFQEHKDLRVLIVDNESGNAGGALLPEEALALVGDGDGRIRTELLPKFVQEQIPNPETQGKQVQIRGAIPVQENVPAAQILKGTLASAPAEELHGFDLVLSKAQTGKGRKRAETQLPPGEYRLHLGFGVTEVAQTNQHAAGPQFLVNFSGETADRDILPRLETKLQKLDRLVGEAAQGDSRALAQDFVKKQEQQRQYREKSLAQSELGEDYDAADWEEAADLLPQLGGAEAGSLESIIKKDLEAGHGQLLEHPKIQDTLKRHLQSRWQESANGRAVKFESRMLMTSNRLGKDEICDHTLLEGAQVLFYRSPVGNANALGILTNRIPEGERHHLGFIKMSRETYAELNSDTDGDKPAIALAEKYPAIVAEVKRLKQPEKAPQPIETPPKQGYQGSIEEVAAAQLQNNIGRMANLSMKTNALWREADYFRENVETQPKEARKFLQGLGRSISASLKSSEGQLPEEAEHLRPRLKEIAELARNPNSDLTKALESTQEFFRQQSGVVAYNLRLEEQSHKSSRRASNESIQYIAGVVKQLSLPALEERNDRSAYLEKPIQATGHTALDRTVQKTNEHWQQRTLSPRPLAQFAGLFQGVTYTPDQEKKAIALKETYDRLNGAAISAKQELQERSEPSLRLIGTSARGNHLEILLSGQNTEHSQAYAEGPLEITLKQEKKQVVALAPENGKNVQLGIVSPVWQRENQELLDKLGVKDKEVLLGQLETRVEPPYSEHQVKAAFGKVTQFVEQARESIPPEEREAVAAALWERSAKSSMSAQQTRGGQPHQKGAAVFTLFGPEIEKRLERLQLTQLTVVGTQRPEINSHHERIWQGETASISIAAAPDYNNPQQTARWLLVDGQPLGQLSERAAQLPVGTQAQAQLTSQRVTTLNLITPKGNAIAVGELGKGAFADANWQAEGKTGMVQFREQGPRKIQAFLKNKPLGVVKAESAQKMRAALGRSVEGYTVEVTIQPQAPSAVRVEVDPETVRYPLPARSESELKGVLTRFSQQQQEAPVSGAQGLLTEVDARLGQAILVDDSFFEALLEDRNKQVAGWPELSEEIRQTYRSFSFVQEVTQTRGEIAIATQKSNGQNNLSAASVGDYQEIPGQSELYLAVDLASAKDPQALKEVLNFPVEYEAMTDGEKIHFVAMPMAAFQQQLAAAVQQQGEVAQLQQAADSPKLPSRMPPPPSLSEVEQVEADFRQANQLQEERTRAIAPVVHRYLYLEGKETEEGVEATGAHHRAYWRKDSSELGLIANGQEYPKMRALIEEGGYKPLPVGDTLKEVQQRGLSEEDVTRFREVIAPLVNQKLAEQQGALQSLSTEKKQEEIDHE